MAEILLIEDDIIVQHVHKTMFQKLGHQVDLVDTAAAALTQLKSYSKYQIIFVDIGLPDMNGYELIRQIRDTFQLGLNFPIIALTGYIGEQEKKDCLAAGATTVLHKPVLMKKMIEILGFYLA